MELVRKAEAAEGEYGGWETLVVTSDPAARSGAPPRFDGGDSGRR